MSSPLHIVHLEDDPNDMVLVRAALERDGIECEVATVSTRDEFVSAIEGGGVELILSDYSLPGFDGITALAVAARIVPHAPFILVSGTMGEEAAIESLRGGATDYVLKSRLNRLAPAVRRAVEEARERRVRHEAETALVREQKFLLALLDSLDAGVVACDQNGILTLSNRMTREPHGLPEEPVPPEQWASYYCLYGADGKTPLDAPAVPLQRALHGEILRRVEIMVRDRTGAARALMVSGQPIVDDSGDKLGAVVILHDVTEHKQLERQLHQAQKMEAMGLLAAGVAHDFNNLLTVVGGYCQLARSRVEPGHPILRDLEEVIRAGERATVLTRQLLAFSRQQVLNPRVLDLNGVIADVSKMLRRLLGADVELVFRPAEGLGSVRADAGQIEQVLVNLIVNARDAMPEGGRITIETFNVDAATDPTAPEGEYVALTVSDTGCGMDAETASRVFEPFFTTKEVGRGTGLGLSTVHGIVKQSDGRITVQSDLGSGTTFVIHLPRAAGAGDSAKTAAPPPAIARGNESILVVDDDAVVLGLVGEILRVHGYTVIEANSGDAALSILQRESSKIDAVVADLVMPRLSGRELLRHMETIRPGLPALLMSGFSGQSVEGALGPRVGFIQKPFTTEALLEKLREVLSGSAATRP